MQSQKVYVSRDVVIDESLHWNWDKGLAEKDKVFLQKTEGKSDSPQLSVLTSRMNSDKDADSPPDFPILKTKSLSEVYEKCNYAALEPSSFVEAVKYEEWRLAMQEEIDMIEKNYTWQLVDRPELRNVIGAKWIFRTKLNPDGSIYKHKASFVVKDIHNKLV